MLCSSLCWLFVVSGGALSILSATAWSTSQRAFWAPTTPVCHLYGAVIDVLLTLVVLFGRATTRLGPLCWRNVVVFSANREVGSFSWGRNLDQVRGLGNFSRATCKTSRIDWRDLRGPLPASTVFSTYDKRLIAKSQISFPNHDISLLPSAVVCAQQDPQLGYKVT